MSTSGLFSYNDTRNEIIDEAAELAGILDPEGGQLTQLQYANFTRMLNRMVKAWMADGLQVWKRKIVSVTLTANTASYTINPRAIRLLDGYFRRTTGTIDTPLKLITREEYNRFGVKSTTGTTTQVFYDATTPTGTVYVYPVPATTANTLQLEFLYPYEDFVTFTDNADMPVEWLEPLVFGLAVRMAYKYGMDEQRLTKLENMADKAKWMALGASQENSVYFVPDNQSIGVLNAGRV